MQFWSLCSPSSPVHFFISPCSIVSCITTPTSLRDHSPRHILSRSATVAFVLNYYLIIFHFYVIFFYSSQTSHRWRSDASFYSILFFASALPASLALAAPHRIRLSSAFFASPAHIIFTCTPRTLVIVAIPLVYTSITQMSRTITQSLHRKMLSFLQIDKDRRPGE